MITALFAIDNTGGLGFQGSMPWPRNKEDLMWFKRTTQNQTVVMGRKTWESGDMPAPLPGRTNILVTHDFIDREDVIQLRGDICAALDQLQYKQNFRDIYVIGGANILQQVRPILDRIFLTRIPGEYINDTFINIDEYLEGFTLVKTTNFETCSIEEYSR